MENQNNNENDKPTIQQTFNYYAPIGQQIAHVDKIVAHFDKNMGIKVDGQDIMPQPSAIDSPDEEWIDEITSCFFGMKENALEFVRMARSMKPKQITDLVNGWLAMDKISKMSFKRDLWKPLHEHGVYKCTETNWNDQVRLPK